MAFDRWTLEGTVPRGVLRRIRRAEPGPAGRAPRADCHPPALSGCRRVRLSRTSGTCRPAGGGCQCESKDLHDALFSDNRRNSVQRVAFRLRVKEEKLEEYKRFHREVWPELLADMRAASIRNYSIFADVGRNCSATSSATIGKPRHGSPRPQRRQPALAGADDGVPGDPGRLRTRPSRWRCWRRSSAWRERAWSPFLPHVDAAEGTMVSAS